MFRYEKGRKKKTLLVAPERNLQQIGPEIVGVGGVAGGPGGEGGGPGGEGGQLGEEPGGEALHDLAPHLEPVVLLGAKDIVAPAVSPSGGGGNNDWNLFSIQE
jgi:hypothetical protein